MMVMCACRKLQWLVEKCLKQLQFWSRIFLVDTFLIVCIYRTKIVFYGQEVLIRAGVSPDQKEKKGLPRFPLLTWQDERMIFFYLSYFKYIWNISKNTSKEKLTVIFIYLFPFFLLTSDKSKWPISGSVDHRTYCVCPYWKLEMDATIHTTFKFILIHKKNIQYNGHSRFFQ